jgi:hypothetical protein
MRQVEIEGENGWSASDLLGKFAPPPVPLAAGHPHFPVAHNLNSSFAGSKSD